MLKYKPDRTRKSRRKRGGLQHVGIERRTLKEDPWQGLSACAKIFYIHLKSRYNGGNNGKIKFPYSAMKGVRGCSTNRAISKAVKELLDEGWIEINQVGGMYRHYNLYRLTFRHDLYAA